MQNIHESLNNILTTVVPFSDDELKKANRYFEFKQYAPNDFIFTQGDVATSIYLILDGIGRYFYLDRNGNEANKSLVRRGDAFASMVSIIDSSPSPFYTQAITHCTAAIIDSNDLVQLAEDNQNWSLYLRRSLERLVLKKEKREAGFLLLSARERYEQFLKDFEDDSQLIPLRHIAMYIGVSNVSLSRIRRTMGLT